MVVSSSCNTLKEFSVFTSLSLVIFLCPSLFLGLYRHWIWFGGNLSLHFHLSDCCLVQFLSPCYLSLGVCFFFIYSVLLFHEFLYPPRWGALLICLWVFFHLVPLWFFSLFAVYASHLSSFILFWIVASIVYFPHIFSLVGFFAV